MILCLRTDTGRAEITLLDASGALMQQKVWQADRTMAQGLLAQLQDVLDAADCTWEQLHGIIAYRGPGSFTGLRIGLTIANTTSYSLKIPIVGQSGDDWREIGRQRLASGGNDRLVMPEYGAAPRVTLPRK